MALMQKVMRMMIRGAGWLGWVVVCGVVGALGGVLMGIVAILISAVGSRIIAELMPLVGSSVFTRAVNGMDTEYRVMMIFLVGPLISLLMGCIGSLSGTRRRGVIIGLLSNGLFWGFIVLGNDTATPSFSTRLEMTIVLTTIGTSAGAVGGGLRQARVPWVGDYAKIERPAP